MKTSIEAMIQSQNILGEGPLWNASEQALYWVDIEQKTIQRYLLGEERIETFEVGVKVGSFGFRTGGGLILATSVGFAFWDSTKLTLERIAHPEKGKEGARFNDGKVDQAGRFWAGTMTDEGATSSLYRLSSDLKISTMQTGVTISNGLGWSPDNRVFYHSDTSRHTIFAYDFELETGSISNKRPFCVVPQEEGMPDGLTVDAEGFVWCALWNGWKVIRIAPDGKVVHELRLPVSLPTSCAFGGENLDQLFITSASVGFDEKARQQQPFAGDVFRVEPGVVGLPEPKFITQPGVLPTS